MGLIRRAWSSPNVLVGLPEQQAQPYYIKGSENAAHLPCLLLMSTSISWNLPDPQPIQHGQNIRPRTEPPYPQDIQRNSSLAHWAGDLRVGWEWTVYIPVVQAAEEPLESQTVLYSVSSHGWTHRPHPPCGGQTQSMGFGSSP